MSDVFLSYASEDRGRARVLAQALEEQGWSVFWDRTIPPGLTWHEYIGRELQEARCVLVAWTETSIRSNWVLEEAGDASKRGVLIPVFLEEVEPPLGFRSQQAADLSGWDGESGAAAFGQLTRGMARLLDAPPEEGQPPPAPGGESGGEPVPVSNERVSGERTGPPETQERSAAGEYRERKKTGAPRNALLRFARSGPGLAVIAAGLVAVGLILKFTFGDGPEAPPPLSSDFEASDEGWRGWDDGEGKQWDPNYPEKCPGPERSRCIQLWERGSTHYFRSPESWRKDWRDFYEGKLTYSMRVDLTRAGSEYTDVPDVKIDGGVEIEGKWESRSLHLFIPKSLWSQGGEWKDYEFPLKEGEFSQDDETLQWKTEAGTPADEEHFESVLSQVAGLYIRADYSARPETKEDKTYLDDVTIAPPGDAGR